MDIDLGHGICGMTTTKIINSISKIPVLFHTSNTEQYIREGIGNKFSIYYLSKKNSFQSLLSSIENTIFSFNSRKKVLFKCESKNSVSGTAVSPAGLIKGLPPLRPCKD